MKNVDLESENPRRRRLSRRFILFAAAVRQATSGEALSNKIGVKVTDSQADALRFLALNVNVTIGEIAKGLGHTISGATKAINRLEKNGWVERVQGGTDHRSVHVQLTEHGSQLANTLLSETEERMNRILWKLRPETVERLEDVLEEFLRDFIDDEAIASKLCVACGFERGINCYESDVDCIVAKTIKNLESEITSRKTR
ncbi:MAG: MarR family transcriptional regulator [Candidatus Omnitrophota bacterium]|jgi:DNA-binding MarR family transcriptional regulator|nr:MAG: MarR family transcriptional regulator [Candidatus Omnitrophota bacterium]